jgi:hypothetical protein
VCVCVCVCLFLLFGFLSSVCLSFVMFKNIFFSSLFVFVCSSGAVLVFGVHREMKNCELLAMAISFQFYVEWIPHDYLD